MLIVFSPAQKSKPFYPKTLTLHKLARLTLSCELHSQILVCVERIPLMIRLQTRFGDVREQAHIVHLSQLSLAL